MVTSHWSKDLPPEFSTHSTPSPRHSLVPAWSTDQQHVYGEILPAKRTGKLVRASVS